MYNIKAIRDLPIEQERTKALLALLPCIDNGSALDIGARDGWYSKLLSQKYTTTALDLLAQIIYLQILPVLQVMLLLYSLRTIHLT